MNSVLCFVFAILSLAFSAASLAKVFTSGQPATLEFVAAMVCLLLAREMRRTR